MREKLNAIIVESETRRGLIMPRIGKGHAGFPGAIFSLLQDPGGPVHTPRSGALSSGLVDIDNDDLTANWCKALLERLEIPKSAATPWNALGAYNERPTVKAINENVPLCQKLLDISVPAAVVAQGQWAHKIAESLRFAGPIFCVPHPSPRGRMRRNAANEIEAAFRAAWLSRGHNNLIKYCVSQ